MHGATTGGDDGPTSASIRKRQAVRLLPLPFLAPPVPARRARSPAARSRRCPACRCRSPTPRGGDPPRRRRRTPGRWLRSNHAGPAGSRSYDVYLPAGHRRTTRAPLLMLLHGCNQSAEQFVAATRFTALADRHGFVIAAPHQTRGHQPGGCWRWYEGAHQDRGRRRTRRPGRDRRGDAGRTVPLADRPVAGLRGRDLRRGSDGARSSPRPIPTCSPRSACTRPRRTDRPAPAGNALGAMRGRGAVTAPPPGSRDGAADRRPGDGGPGGARAQRQTRRRPVAGVRPGALDRAAGPAADHPVPHRRSGVPPTVAGYTVTRWYSARGRKRLEYWEIEGLGHAWSGGLDGRVLQRPPRPPGEYGDVGSSSPRTASDAARAVACRGVAGSAHGPGPGGSSRPGVDLAVAAGRLQLDRRSTVVVGRRRPTRTTSSPTSTSPVNA